MDETKLLADLKAGSRGAFEEIVRRHQLAIRWQISRTVSNAQAVDDLAQDVFLDLLRARLDTNWRAPESLRGWLLGMARNKAVDFVRRNARLAVVRTRLEQFSAESSGEAAEEIAGGQRERQLVALRHCLDLLQPPHREVIDEFYRQAKSSELIATRLGKGSGAVRMLLVRIRQALGKCIRKQLELLP